MNNKKELSYFQLKLETYLDTHHPDKVNDSSFISSRSQEALNVYCDAIKQGYTHLEAEELSSETLFNGLHFSLYDTLVSILENEFEKELPDPLPHRLAPILLKNGLIQELFNKYAPEDDFDGTPAFDLLYTELTGTIVLLIETNKLPTVE